MAAAVTAGAPPGTAAPPDLSRLFRPRSVALVGATDRSGWSVTAFENLRRYSPGVAVHCVNPRRDTVHGVPAAPSLAAIGEPVDLLYVMSPRDTVPDVIHEAGQVGAGAAVVLTAGFGETADGRAAERRLIDAANETGVRVLGPNGSGYINVGHRITPFGLGLPHLPDPGGAHFVLQSGGLMKPLLFLSRSWGVGVGLLAGTGNEAALSVTDVARYLLEEEETGAIGLFVEAFRDADGFRALARRAAELDRPVVVLPVGRSEEARRSALSHTGALTGDVAVTSAVLRDLGVIEVGTLEELVATTGLLATGARPRGGRLAVITASGGSCELLADKAADEGLTLPPLPEQAADALRELLPSFAHVQNPLDVTGYATVDPGLPATVAEVVAQATAGNFDVLLFQAFVSPPVRPADPAPVRAHFARIAEALAAAPVPALLQDEVAAELSDYARELYRDLGLTRLPGIDVGLTALAHAVRYTAWRAAADGHAGEDAARPFPDNGRPTRPGGAEEGAAGPAGEGPLSEAAALGVLARHGVPVVPHRLAANPEEAAEAAREFGVPVVLKICSPDIAHKSDVGGVLLDVPAAEAADACARLLDRVAARVPDARIEGVLVAPYRTGGVELLAGVHRDPVWGPVLALGFGGVLVEVLADVAIRPLPVRPATVRDMLGELRGAALLRGVRGRPAADLDAVAGAVAALADAALALGETWQAIEINPLRVDGARVEALDALIVTASRHTDSTVGRRS